MGTATSRASALIVLVVVLAGCGSASHDARHQASFAGVRAGAAPSSWPRAHIPGGAAMAYPPGWKRIESDSRAASAALFGPRRRFLGYLNLTPQQSNETLADWPRFRIAHNADDEDHDVRTLAVSGTVTFRDGRGRCVEDSYVTSTNAHYTELACLVRGARSGVVALGAAPPGQWTRLEPTLARAISSVTVG
jgi:hypothetical protein